MLLNIFIFITLDIYYIILDIILFSIFILYHKITSLEHSQESPFN